MSLTLGAGLLLVVACAPTVTVAATSPASTVSATGRTDRVLDMVTGHYAVRLTALALAQADRANVDLAAITERALRQVGQLLPGPKASIVIDLDPSSSIPEVGVGGRTNPASGEVTIALDARAPAAFAAAVRDWLPLALAHELHHSRRITVGPGYGRTLGEAIVTEGLADTFAREVYPESPLPPWVTALDADAQHRWWGIARPQLDVPETTVTHTRWFFGGPDVPRWAGYTFGFAIVGSYLRSHPGATAATLVRIAANEVLTGSDYNP